jgi:hypothetical protein
MKFEEFLLTEWFNKIIIGSKESLPKDTRNISVTSLY